MSLLNSVAVLFARRDSIYKTLPGCDVYDIDRDARIYRDDLPVVAHPPCRAWGNLRMMAKPLPGEKELAFFAVDQVRRCGGVLEHPRASKLWEAYSLPPVGGGGMDSFGGWTLQVQQFWWGHLAEKSTWLYIVGVDRSVVPPAPLVFREPSHVVTQSRGRKWSPKRPELSKAARERTPRDFALFLLTLARLSAKNKTDIRPYRPFKRVVCALSSPPMATSPVFDTAGAQ